MQDAYLDFPFCIYLLVLACLGRRAECTDGLCTSCSHSLDFANSGHCFFSVLSDLGNGNFMELMWR